MLRKILATGLFAGVAAGLFLSLVHYVAVDPLIRQAEQLEAGVSANAAPAEPAAHADDHGTAWLPGDRLERTGLTILANLILGVGFGLLLAGCYALYGGTVDARRGLLWGLAGFAVFQLAPALGLPPNAPGAANTDVYVRQAWWLGAVAATAAGLAMLVFARARMLKVGGVVILALPHLIGAPDHSTGGSITPELATAFIAASLAATGLFWLALGGISGAVYRRLVGS